MNHKIVLLFFYLEILQSIPGCGSKDITGRVPCAPRCMESMWSQKPCLMAKVLRTWFGFFGFDQRRALSNTY